MAATTVAINFSIEEVFARVLDVPSLYRPRRPRASPLWQIVHNDWPTFLAKYEDRYRKTYGPLRDDAVRVVESYYRCGDLAAGFTLLRCADCGHERLLAFTCKSRCFCPSCSQRHTRQLAEWIAFHLYKLWCGRDCSQRRRRATC